MAQAGSRRRRVSKKGLEAMARQPRKIRQYGWQGPALKRRVEPSLPPAESFEDYARRQEKS